MCMNCTGGKPSTSSKSSYTPKSQSASKGSYRPSTSNPFAGAKSSGIYGTPQVRMSFGKKK